MLIESGQVITDLEITVAGLAGATAQEKVGYLGMISKALAQTVEKVNEMLAQ